jgi:hypothetical protein
VTKASKSSRTPRRAAKSSKRSGGDAGLRRELLREQDQLENRAAALRKQLTAIESGTKKTRRHIKGGGRAGDLVDSADFGAERASLMKELDGFEKAVHKSRLAIFRLAVNEGMNYSDLARAWGVSRQRISALMKEL